MDADEYNRRELAEGKITAAHVSALTRLFQEQQKLKADGMLGPVTRTALEALIPRAPAPQKSPELVINEGWLQGPSVRRVAADPSWYYAQAAFQAYGIMAHYTATNAGTAETMAKRRTQKRDADDRAASWHITIAQDGAVWQMVPLDRGAWHCATGTVTVAGKQIGINRGVIGIELEGHGDVFPEAQIKAAEQVWRALVQGLAISRELAMLEHSRFDPERRRDPGPVWMQNHAPQVLAYAFEGLAR